MSGFEEELFEETLKAKRRLCRKFEKKGLMEDIEASTGGPVMSVRVETEPRTPKDYFVRISMKRKLTTEEKEKIEKAKRKVCAKSRMSIRVEFSVCGVLCAKSAMKMKTGGRRSLPA